MGKPGRAGPRAGVPGVSLGMRPQATNQPMGGILSKESATGM